METIRANVIFTNVAMTDDGDVWWEGMTKAPPAHLIDWQGKDWTPDCGRKAAHPNSRFTVAATQCPSIDPAWDDPAGVPISAFIFGGRRSRHRAAGERGAHVGRGRVQGRDDGVGNHRGGDRRGRRSAPRSLCDAAVLRLPHRRLFRHWLAMGKAIAHPPRIFSVNWFRKDGDGKFPWPGFGENMRVLKWVVDRCRGRAHAAETRDRPGARTMAISTGRAPRSTPIASAVSCAWSARNGSASSRRTTSPCQARRQASRRVAVRARTAGTTSDAIDARGCTRRGGRLAGPLFLRARLDCRDDARMRWRRERNSRCKRIGVP